MDSIYLDTSLLVKLYVPEDGSEQIFNLIKQYNKPLLFNQFQKTELKNAFALKAFRKEISLDQSSNLSSKLHQDIDIGRLKLKKVEWHMAWETTQNLSQEYSKKIGCRTMDILHVAIAYQWKIKTFLSNDDRQKKLATELNMNIST